MQGRQVRPHQPQHDLVAVLTTYYCYCYYYSLRTRRSTASWNSAPLESTALPALGLGLGSVLGLGLG